MTSGLLVEPAFEESAHVFYFNKFCLLCSYTMRFNLAEVQVGDDFYAACLYVIDTNLLSRKFVECMIININK